jgi:hypothetical protein
MYITQSDGSKVSSVPTPITVLANMRSASTFQEVINRFSETIVPSSRDDRDPNKSYLLSAQSRGVARAPKRANKGLMMHESLLFLPGQDYYHGSNYSSQGIFMLEIETGAINEIPQMFGLENITTLTDNHKKVRNGHGKLGDNYMGKYYSSKGHILLSEILNNDVVVDGTAVLIMACKSICGTSDDQHGHHGLHDTQLAVTVPSIQRVYSSDTGNAKQVVFNPLDDFVVERDHYSSDSSDDDDDDDVVGIKRRSYNGGRMSTRKSIMKKTKLKKRVNTRKRKQPYINKKNKKWASSKKMPQTKKRKALY